MITAKKVIVEYLEEEKCWACIVDGKILKKGSLDACVSRALSRISPRRQKFEENLLKKLHRQREFLKQELKKIRKEQRKNNKNKGG